MEKDMCGKCMRNPCTCGEAYRRYPKEQRVAVAVGVLKSLSLDEMTEAMRNYVRSADNKALALRDLEGSIGCAREVLALGGWTPEGEGQGKD